MKKTFKFTNEEWEKIISAIEGSSAAALWDEANDNDLVRNASYEDRKQFFLSVMYRLMKEGRLKLGNKSKFLEGTIEEQVEQYSDQWPKDESMLDKFDFQFIQDPQDGALYYWAEGGFVWIYEDGFEEWT